MVHKTLYLLLSLFISASSIAQTLNKDVIASIPDEAATDDQLIYLLTLPEWDKIYSHAEPKIDFQRLEMANSYHTYLIPLGVTGSSNGAKQLVQFDTKNLRFVKKPNYNEFDLIDKIATSEKDLYYLVKQDRSDQSKTRINTFKKRGSQTENKSISISEMLASIGKGSSKVEKASSWLTQDKAHLLIDIEVSTKTLRADVQERLWLTLRLADLKVKNILSLNDLEWYKEEKAMLEPFFIKENELELDFLDNSPGAPLASPGTDVVLAAYRNKQFNLNWTVNVSVNMATGEFKFLTPPMDGMSTSAKEVLRKDSTPEEVKKYLSPVWLTQNDEYFRRNEPDKNFEKLIYYSEKDMTYMTWHPVAVPAKSGFQLVFKDSKGEILNRMPRQGGNEPLNMSKYTIRKMGSNEIVSEYTLIASLARKISHDGKYLVSAEGEKQVLTLRDRLTGKLIDIAPRARTQFVYEVPEGFVLKDKFTSGIGYSLLSGSKNQGNLVATNKTSTNSAADDAFEKEWKKYETKFASFPNKFSGTTTFEGKEYQFSLALADEKTMQQATYLTDIGALIIQHPEQKENVYFKLHGIKSVNNAVVFQCIRKEKRGSFKFTSWALQNYLQLNQTEDPNKVKISTYYGSGSSDFIDKIKNSEADPRIQLVLNFESSK